MTNSCAEIKTISTAVSPSIKVTNKTSFTKMPLSSSTSSHVGQNISSAKLTACNTNIGDRRLVTTRPIASSSRIRVNLLHKLGIEKELSDASIPSTARESLLGDVATFHEPLKCKEEEGPESSRQKWRMSLHSFFKPEEEDVSSETIASDASLSDSSGSGSDKSSKQRRLTFHEEVKVVPIPMRDEYSDRVRERLWTSRGELTENAHRNAVEFAAEGWDWRTVTEDEEMYRCVTGELVHPVHCQAQQDDDEQDQLCSNHMADHEVSD